MRLSIEMARRALPSFRKSTILFKRSSFPVTTEGHHHTTVWFRKSTKTRMGGASFKKNAKGPPFWGLRKMPQGVFLVPTAHGWMSSGVGRTSFRRDMTLICRSVNANLPKHRDPMATATTCRARIPAGLTKTLIF